LLRVELRQDEVLGDAGDGGGHWQMTIGKRARKVLV
jgi:hypothetical protein